MGLSQHAVSVAQLGSEQGKVEKDVRRSKQARCNDRLCRSPKFQASTKQKANVGRNQSRKLPWKRG